MDKWLRFEHAGKAGFGKMQGDTITVYEGDMFAHPVAMARTLALSAVKLLTPTQPTTMLAIWNNFHALAAKLKAAIPKESLYLVKTANSSLANRFE